MRRVSCQEIEILILGSTEVSFGADARGLVPSETARHLSLKFRPTYLGTDKAQPHEGAGWPH